ncbi:myeloid-associated differentiation marker-like protein 2 [Genypterus blacodes]|uniref:myeloid-associated differentiation marker-like protein 2 n=1 Tax=Genypterus blacodes TaxID=154954 RepID=UPI003F7708C5
MCSLLKDRQFVLRLLEIIFSFLAFIVELSKLGIASPWGVWCEFVWSFCFIVPLVFIILEATKWNLLLAAFISNWADLTCGLTVLCAVMIASASIVFAAIFVCFSCVYNISCLIFSLLATLVFLVDAFMQKSKSPGGYLSSVRGLLRMAQAFVACILLTAASDYFIGVEKYARPFGMICCIIIFVVCLLVTFLLIILHLLTLLQALLPFGLKMVDLVFNIVASVSYLCAVILWSVFGYRRYRRYWYYWYYNRYCSNCTSADLNTVTAGSVINLILYLVDLLLSVKDR